MRTYAVHSSNATVRVVEFGDVLDLSHFGVHRSLEALASEGLIRLEYAHFVPPDARDAASRRCVAAGLEAAGRQGAFLAFHHLLLREDISLNRAGLLYRARLLGLDVERFTRDLTSHTVQQALERDATLARAWNVQRLPSLLIDGQRYQGRFDEREIRQAVLSRRRSTCEAIESRFVFAAGSAQTSGSSTAAGPRSWRRP